MKWCTVDWQNGSTEQNNKKTMFIASRGRLVVCWVTYSYSHWLLDEKTSSTYIYIYTPSNIRKTLELRHKLLHRASIKTRSTLMVSLIGNLRHISSFPLDVVPPWTVINIINCATQTISYMHVLIVLSAYILDLPLSNILNCCLVCTPKLAYIYTNIKIQSRTATVLHQLVSGYSLLWYDPFNKGLTFYLYYKWSRTKFVNMVLSE